VLRWNGRNEEDSTMGKGADEKKYKINDNLKVVSSHYLQLLFCFSLKQV